MQWIVDRPPTVAELHDSDLTFATGIVERFGKTQTLVNPVTGFYIRSRWQVKREGERVVAWMQVPEAYAGIIHAKDD